MTFTIFTQIPVSPHSTPTPHTKPLPLETTNLFSVITFFFKKYSTFSISFSVQLILLSIMSPCCCKWWHFLLFNGWIIFYCLYRYVYIHIYFLVAHKVKNLLALQETRVQSLDWEDSLEDGMATHYRILAWRIPWTEEPVDYSSWCYKESGMTEWQTWLSD